LTVISVPMVVPAGTYEGFEKPLYGKAYILLIL